MYLHLYTHAGMDTRIYLHTYTHAGMYIRIYLHTYIHTCIYVCTCIRTYMPRLIKQEAQHLHMHVCTYAGMYTYLHACLAWLSLIKHTYACMYVCRYVCTRIYVCIHTYMHTYIPPPAACVEWLKKWDMKAKKKMTPPAYMYTCSSKLCRALERCGGRPLCQHTSAYVSIRQHEGRWSGVEVDRSVLE